MNCATRKAFLRSIWFRIVQCLEWMLSGTIPHPRLGSICFISSPFQEHIAEISETMTIRSEWDCGARELCQWDTAPKWRSPADRVISLLLGLGCHFQRKFCARTGSVHRRSILWDGWGQDTLPGLVLLMGKTWQFPIIQNILVVSLGYFFWDTHFWMTVLIFIYVFISIPNILLTSSWEI